MINGTFTDISISNFIATLERKWKQLNYLKRTQKYRWGCYGSKMGFSTTSLRKTELMLHTESIQRTKWRRRGQLLFLGVLLFQGYATAAQTHLQPTSRTTQPSQKSTAAIIIDDTLDKKNTSVLAGWMVYAGARALWIDGKFLETFPDQGTYRYSFSEELDARKNLINFWLSLKKKPPAPIDPYFDQLVDIDRAGFLREYVWVYFFSDHWLETPDGLQLDKFNKWKHENQPGHQAQTRAIAKPGKP